MEKWRRALEVEVVELANRGWSDIQIAEAYDMRVERVRGLLARAAARRMRPRRCPTRHRSIDRAGAQPTPPSQTRRGVLTRTWKRQVPFGWRRPNDDWRLDVYVSTLRRPDIANVRVLLADGRNMTFRMELLRRLLAHAPVRASGAILFTVNSTSRTICGRPCAMRVVA